MFSFKASFCVGDLVSSCHPLVAVQQLARNVVTFYPDDMTHPTELSFEEYGLILVSLPSA